MSPKSLKTLQEAAEYVAGEKHKGTAPELIILAMIKHFGAKRWDGGYSGFKLRCGGVSVSCTTSRDRSLLAYWERAAEKRLARESMQ
jgi:hypothetical protein